MNEIKSINAIEYVSTLRSTVNAIWKYAEIHPLDSVTYSDNGYGAMQYEELREVLNLLNKMKKSLDDLHFECLDIPADIEVA